MRRRRRDNCVACEGQGCEHRNRLLRLVVIYGVSLGSKKLGNTSGDYPSSAMYHLFSSDLVTMGSKLDSLLYSWP